MLRYDEGGTDTCNSSSSFTDLGAGLTDKESGFIAAGNSFASVIVKAMVVCNNPDTVCEPECFTTLKDFEEFNINEKDKDGKRLYDFNWIPMVAMLMLFPFVLLPITIQFATRKFELLFWQLFGPFMIATYVNEKSDMFQKYVMTVLNLYVATFVQLFMLYFFAIATKEIAANTFDRASAKADLLTKIIYIVSGILLYYAGLLFALMPLKVYQKYLVGGTWVLKVLYSQYDANKAVAGIATHGKTATTAGVCCKRA